MDNKYSITKSEWQIMKVLWENDYCTSGEVHKIVSQTQDWSITTVKTLLTRLLKKDVIGAEKDDRYPKYYAVKTEMECVQNAMQDLIQQVYGDSLNYETEHFQFFGSNDQHYIDILSSTIEQDYIKLAKTYQYHLTDKTRIYLYSSLKKLHSAFGTHNGPKWLRSGHLWGVIHMAPLETFDNIDPNNTLMFGLSEIILDRISTHLPYYIHRGISAYYSGVLSHKRIQETLSENLDRITFDTLLDLTIGSDNIGELNNMELAHAFVDFLVSTKGEAIISKLIWKKISLSNIINKEKDTIIEEWKSFITQKYGVR